MNHPSEIQKKLSRKDNQIVPPVALESTFDYLEKGINRVKFTKVISTNCQKIITEFCATKPTQRLGYSKSGYKEIR